jgi:tetratricopeptide (TPR) repeat protein
MSSQAVEVLYALGHWLLTEQRHKDAADTFRVMTLTKPDDERGWLALGTCHEAIGQKLIASELYKIGTTIAAPAIRCTIARGRVLRDLEQIDLAMEAFEEAHDLALSIGDDELARMATYERSMPS